MIQLRLCAKVALVSAFVGSLTLSNSCVTRSFNKSSTKGADEAEADENFDTADNSTAKAVIQAIADTTQWQDDRTLEASDEEMECAALQNLGFHSTERDFNLENAIILARASFLSYKKRHFMEEEFRKMGLKVDLLTDEQVGTDAYVISDDKRILVVFRGTEVRKTADLLTDLDLRKDYPWFWGRTHKGFSRAYRRITSIRGNTPADMQRPENRSLFTVLTEHGFDSPLWSNIDATVKPAANASDAYKSAKKSLFISGHSLGGGLATLLAADLTHREIYFRNIGDENDCTVVKEKPELVTAVYTFGSPRVGDPSFAKCYDAALRDQTHRVVRSNDIVAQIPIFDYKHVGQLEFIGADGSLKHDFKIDNPLIRYLGRTFAAFKLGKPTSNFTDHFIYVQPLQHNFNSLCSPMPVWKK